MALTLSDYFAAAAAVDSQSLGAAVATAADRNRFYDGVSVCCCNELAWGSVELHVGKVRTLSRMLYSLVSTPAAAMPRNLKQ
jgi:hypothetical protein